jgi:uncharacterized protein
MMSSVALIRDKYHKPNPHSIITMKSGSQVVAVRNICLTPSVPKFSENVESSTSEKQNMTPKTFMLTIALLAFGFMSTTLNAQSETPHTEEEVTFPNGEIMLAGTLSLPAGEKPYPAVILISGSGPSDRDESLAPLASMKPFQLLAVAFARNGIAVLRYDDRGVGASTGVFETATSADFATDAQAAFDYLQSREDIDSSKIGLLGHSEGGLIAPMVAADNEDVAFVISLAGPGVVGEDLIMLQIERVMQAQGVPEAAIETKVAEEGRMLDLIVSQNWDALEAEMRDTLPEQLAALPEAQRESLGNLDAIIQRSMTQYQHWFYFFLTHDPAEDWSQVRVPVLALYGDLDTQVDVDQNAPALQAALAAAGNEDVTVVSFPTANHLFQDAVTGSPDEYGTLEQTFLPDLLPTVMDWTKAHVE